MKLTIEQKYAYFQYVEAGREFLENMGLSEYQLYTYLGALDQEEIDEFVSSDKAVIAALFFEEKQAEEENDTEH